MCRQSFCVSTQCVVVGLGIATILITAACASCTPDSPLPPEALDAAREIDCGQMTYENSGASFSTTTACIATTSNWPAT